jgi:hypothetical protein
MSDWLMQSNYMIMILQVFITLVLVPLLSIKKLVNIANHYGLVRYPNAKPDVEKVLITSKKKLLDGSHRHFISSECDSRSRNHTANRIIKLG